MIDFEYISSIYELNKSDSLRKEVALIQIESKLTYLLGNFTEDNRCLTGIMLTKKEVLSLLNWAKEKSAKDFVTEEEKFLKDYLQQAHNGKVQKEKEKEL